MSETPNFSELRNKINNWDIEAEEMLLRKIKIFTDNYIDQFNEFSKNMDCLDMHLVSAEVENFKAVNQLKVLATNRFVEDILDDKTDLEPETQNVNNEEQNKEIVINDIESKKEAINISLQHLQNIQSKRGKNKEQIEDDTVSVSSSNLNLENLAKNVKLPFVIGTEDFKKDKTLGLTNFVEENKEEENADNKKTEEIESEDSDIEEFVSDIAVDEKVKAKWKKVKEKKKKKKEKEKLKKAAKSAKVIESKNSNTDFTQEEKEQINLQKETENGFIIIENQNNQTGAAIPPPPPPPPMPPQIQTIPQQKTETIKNVNLPNENNNIPNNNNQVSNNNPNNDKENNNTNINTNNNTNNNNIIIQPKIVNVMPKEENINVMPKIENIMPKKEPESNNNPIEIKSLRKKTVFNNVRVDNFLGAEFFPDEEEDMDDGLFSRKNRKVPIISNENQNNNNDQNESQNEHIPQTIHIINPPAGSDLGIAKKKLNNMFGDGSDDDEEDIKPKIIKKQENVENPPIKEEPKLFEIKEEKKEEEKKEEEKKENDEDKQIKIELNSKKRKSLLIEKDEDNNFPKIEKKQNSKEIMVNSLFDLPEEDQKNNTNTNKEIEKSKPDNTKTQSKKKLAFLFDDDDD